MNSLPRCHNYGRRLTFSALYDGRKLPFIWVYSFLALATYVAILLTTLNACRNLGYLLLTNKQQVEP